VLLFPKRNPQSPNTLYIYIYIYIYIRSSTKLSTFNKKAVYFRKKDLYCFHKRDLCQHSGAPHLHTPQYHTLNCTKLPN